MNAVIGHIFVKNVLKPFHLGAKASCARLACTNHLTYIIIKYKIFEFPIIMMGVCEPYSKNLLSYENIQDN